MGSFIIHFILSVFLFLSCINLYAQDKRMQSFSLESGAGIVNE